MDPVAVVAAADGIATTRELRAAGCSEYALTAAVRIGRLHRIRKGCYTTLDAFAPRVVAVRSGGVLTGISALHELDAWVLAPPTQIHVAVPAHFAGTTRISGVVLHWEDPTAASVRSGIASIGDALVRAALDEPVDVAVPCFDWAITTNRLDRVDLERTLLRIPDGAWLGTLIDPRSRVDVERAIESSLAARGLGVAGKPGELTFRRHRKLRTRGSTAQLSSDSRDARAE